MLERLKVLFECFFNWPFWWPVKPEGKLEDADVIIALSFGKQRDNPGLSNLMIFLSTLAIQELIVKKQGWGLPLFLQWEVAAALPEKYQPEHFSKLLLIIQKHRKEGYYLDTYEALSQMTEAMRKEGFQNPVLITHRWHLWRAKKVLEKMGINPIITRDSETISFDPKSLQWWTRNWFFWVLRELPARLIYFRRGWI